MMIVGGTQPWRVDSRASVKRTPEWNKLHRGFDYDALMPRPQFYRVKCDWIYLISNVIHFARIVNHELVGDTSRYKYVLTDVLFQCLLSELSDDLTSHCQLQTVVEGRICHRIPFNQLFH